jgi:hypothetical protein
MTPQARQQILTAMLKANADHTRHEIGDARATLQQAYAAIISVLEENDFPLDPQIFGREASIMTLGYALRYGWIPRPRFQEETDADGICGLPWVCNDVLTKWMRALEAPISEWAARATGAMSAAQTAVNNTRRSTDSAGLPPRGRRGPKKDMDRHQAILGIVRKICGEDWRNGWHDPKYLDEIAAELDKNEEITINKGKGRQRDGSKVTRYERWQDIAGEDPTKFKKDIEYALKEALRVSK